MQGRVKFHRKITEREWYSDANTFRVFFHLITIANHKDWKRQGIDVKRWQTITSIDSLAEQIWLTSQKVRTAMDKLISTWEIAKKTTNRNTIVTVLKYCDYNDYDWEDNKQITSQITNKQQTDNKQITTNKNDKNKKNEKEIYEQHILDFIEYRKNIKKPMTNKAIELFIDKLHKLSSNKNDQIKMVEKSIMNNWLSVFALHEKEMTISIQKIQIDYQQEVAKDKDNKKAIRDKYISEYWSDTMQQVLDKINTLSFTSSLL